MAKQVIKSFVVGRAFRDGHLGTMAGQPPRRDLDIDRRALQRLVSQPPPPFSTERMLARPVFSTRGAVSDLGLDAATENEWAGFLQKAVYGSEHEGLVRQQLMERLLNEDWDPELRKVMFQRAMSLYHNMRKARPVEIVTMDELRKAGEGSRGGKVVGHTPAGKPIYQGQASEGPSAQSVIDKVRSIASNPNPQDVRTAMITVTAAARADASLKPKLKEVVDRFAGMDIPAASKKIAQQASKVLSKARKTDKKPAAKESKPGGGGRGGDFYRRVPKEDGKGYRYYYTPEQYNSRPDAHHSGDDVKGKAAGKDLSKLIDKAGESGCAVGDFKDLVKKYGSQHVSASLKKECGEKGSMVYSGGRFYKRRRA